MIRPGSGLEKPKAILLGTYYSMKLSNSVIRLESNVALCTFGMPIFCAILARDIQHFNHIIVTRNRADFVDLLPKGQLANWIDDPAG
jgi:hypothetical protein